MYRCKWTSPELQRQDVSKARLKAGDSPATEACHAIGVSAEMHVGWEKMVGGGRLVHG